jgi:hypothetical protein
MFEENDKFVIVEVVVDHFQFVKLFFLNLLNNYNCLPVQVFVLLNDLMIDQIKDFFHFD